MQLTVNGESHDFISLTTFRAQWGLSADFTVMRFSPKDWTGLGSLERGGPALARLRQLVVRAVPATIRLHQLREHVLALSGLALSRLYGIIIEDSSELIRFGIDVSAANYNQIGLGMYEGPNFLFAWFLFLTRPKVAA